MKSTLIREQKNDINAARKAILEFKKIVNSNHKTAAKLIQKLHNHKTKIDSPIIKNTISSILQPIIQQNIEKTKQELNQRTFQAAEHLDNSYNLISEFGHKKIRNGAVVYVHDYSVPILNILLKAKHSKTHFTVVTTETNPFLTGCLTAMALAKNKISVKFYSDMALRQALKAADIVLLKADAVAEDGKIYAMIGSELIAELAQRYEIPVYACADSWELNQNIAEHEKSMELRPKQELWPNPPKAINIMNYGFEKINQKLVSGIITELGIHKPHTILSEMKKQYPWI